MLIDLHHLDLGRDPGAFTGLAADRIEEWTDLCDAPDQVQPRRDGQMRADHEALLPALDFSRRASRTLFLACRHLQGIKDLTEMGGVSLAPTAALSRSALLGAAKTVYMLHPDDPAERLRRALALENSDLNSIDRARKMSTELTQAMTLSARERSDLNSQLAQGNKEIDESRRQVATKLAELGRKPGETVGEGETVRFAATLLGHDERALAATRSAWDLGTFAAHSNMMWWELQQGFEGGATVNSLAELLLPPVVVTDLAWQLWNGRRTEPAA